MAAALASMTKATAENKEPVKLQLHYHFGRMVAIPPPYLTSRTVTPTEKPPQVPVLTLSAPYSKVRNPFWRITQPKPISAMA